MSDFDPPESPDPSPRQMKKDNEARDLEAGLTPLATKLGLKIRVVADPAN